MQQIHRIVENGWNENAGIRKFNEWMREHPAVKIVCMKVVPRNEHYEFYAVLDIPDEEGKTNE